MWPSRPPVSAHAPSAPVHWTGVLQQSQDLAALRNFAGELNPVVLDPAKLEGRRVGAGRFVVAHVGGVALTGLRCRLAELAASRVLACCTSRHGIIRTRVGVFRSFHSPRESSFVPGRAHLGQTGTLSAGSAALHSMSVFVLS